MALVLLTSVLPLATAQEQGSPVRWWHSAIAVGGLSALMLLDRPVQRFAQNHRGAGSDDVAGGFRHFGQPEGYGTVTAGLILAGLLSHDPNLTRAGGRLGASVLLAAGFVGGSKLVAGRPRPDQSLDADGFVPFSGQGSLPSGHSALAFAFATSLADDIHQPLATVGLYTLAGGVAWSRVNDNRHWLSDVAAGALVGIASAKLASGRWRIFNLRPPSLIAAPSGLSVGWHGTF